MTREKKESRALSDTNRFWIHSESCYTAKQLRLREQILDLRSKSKINPKYLANHGSWFEADTQALIDIYKDKWFYLPGLKPTQTLSQDDFYAPPIDSKYITEDSLYSLMGRIGNYLIERNQFLSPEHLNDPMNFFFFDVNQILKQLCQQTIVEEVREQLGFLKDYLSAIEGHIEPTDGSYDRQFLTEIGDDVKKKIEPELDLKIESKLLKDKVESLSKSLQQLSRERNGVLHFSLHPHAVEMHPSDFSEKLSGDLTAHPSHAAKNCMLNNQVVQRGPLLSESSAPVSPSPLVAMKQLTSCPEFHLLPTANQQHLKSYAYAITDLVKLEYIDAGLKLLIKKLNQGGELQVIKDYGDQIPTLMSDIILFLERSSPYINEIIAANDARYYSAQKDQKELSWLTSWFSEGKELIAIIKNHDNLTRFLSLNSGLKETNKRIKAHANEVSGHLNTLKTITASTQYPRLAISDTAAFPAPRSAIFVEGAKSGGMEVVYEIRDNDPVAQSESPLSRMVQGANTLGNNTFFSIAYTAPAIGPFFSNTVDRITHPHYESMSLVHQEQNDNWDNFNLMALVSLGVMALCILFLWGNRKKEVRGESVQVCELT